jgi:hypothetical protein
MPLSNDNQDYGIKDNKKNSQSDKVKSENALDDKADENKMTTDNLKGKKVDADPENETDKPADV